MSSCEDMLEVESDRVEYDMGDLTLNDTVYSVLGILKQVQAVADRQVLLGELRGDLMVVNEGSAVNDIQKIARFEFDGDNQYLDVKDYYAIINNCNLYLARVDTTLSHNNIKLMLREYVAVKSVRAWTYLQLVTNYDKVPYFTEPILTHSLSQEISERPKLGIDAIADSLIKDLTPFADPRQYPMPKFKGLSYSTSLYFMPIRQLLGDLYLWKGEYRSAIDCYYNLIVDNQYVTDASSLSRWMSEEVKDDDNPHGNYSPLTTFDSKNTTALASFASSTEDGTVSNLPLVINGDGATVGSHQVASSPGLTALSKRQTYYFAKPNGNQPAIIVKNPNSDKRGDARLYQYIDEKLNPLTGINYEGVITKFGKSNNLKAIKFGRPVQAYLRLAEALAGLASEEPSTVNIIDGVTYDAYWENAEKIAMYILRFGLGQRTFDTGKDGKHSGLPKELRDEIESGKYTIRKLTSVTSVSVEVPVFEIDPETGEEVPVMEINPETGEEVQKTTTEITLEPNYDYITLDFTNSVFRNNMGIHGFGSGDVEWDESLTFDNDSIIAAYLKLSQKENPDTTWVKNEDGSIYMDSITGGPVVLSIDYYDVTQKDKVKYLRNMILDECALETALEGYRFTDLIRFAKAMEDKNVLIKRVASRHVENKRSIYYDASDEVYDEDNLPLIIEYDTYLTGKLEDEKNWYLPLK